VNELKWCRCAAKVGQWSWHGLQAQSGAWVTPAFALACSKLDAIRPFKAFQAVGVPVVGRACATGLAPCGF
jgi:hypothetical protein